MFTCLTTGAGVGGAAISGASVGFVSICCRIVVLAMISEMGGDFISGSIDGSSFFFVGVAVIGF